jgi:hypothetical protein
VNDLTTNFSPFVSICIPFERGYAFFFPLYMYFLGFVRALWPGTVLGRIGQKNNDHDIIFFSFFFFHERMLLIYSTLTTYKLLDSFHFQKFLSISDIIHSNGLTIDKSAAIVHYG